MADGEGVYPREEEFWRELKVFNEDKDRINQTKLDKRRTVDAICSQLMIKGDIKECILTEAMRLDARKLNYCGGLRALAIGLIARFVNFERKRKCENFGYEDRIQNDEDFRQLADKLDVDTHEAVNKVKEQLFSVWR